MATEKWTAGSGVGFTWTAAFLAADINSLANAQSILSSVTVANQTALDIFCDISFSFGSITTTGAPFIGVYIYPLNQDGSTYGDNQFTAGTQSASVPGTNYWKASIDLPAGTQVCTGIYTGLILPPGTFKFLMQNNLGVGLAASANTFSYRTYNRSIA